MYISTGINLKSPTTSEIQFGAKEFADDDRIFTEFNWISDSQLLVRAMNRVQDIQRVYLLTHNMEKNSWYSNLIRDEPTGDGAWHERLQPMTIIPASPHNGRENVSYIEIMENENGYAHIAFFADIKSSKPTAWLTLGNFDVDKICGFDNDKNIVYFTSTEVHSTQRHLYSVNFAGKHTKLKMTPPPNVKIKSFIPFLSHSLGDNIDDIGYYSVSFSPRSHYYVLAYQGPDIPWVTLYSAYNPGIFYLKFLIILDFVVPISKRETALYSQFAFPKRNYITIPNGNGDRTNFFNDRNEYRDNRARRF